MKKSYRFDWKHIIASLLIASIVLAGCFAATNFSFADEASNSQLVNIDSFPIELSETSFLYNGTEQMPEVTIEGLTEGTDYSVEYSDGCVEAGRYNVVITGVNDGETGYTGTIIRSFTINKYTYRIYGDTRYDTSLKTADVLKDEMNTESFDTIVLASGQNYPDALAGSTLAIENDAPIILINDAVSAKVIEYIESNLTSGGKIYILGGFSSVSESIETSLTELGFNVNRLGGETRYETNLLILEEISNEAGKPIAVCSGSGFADCLSVSSSGCPVLLVNSDNGLDSNQIAYLEDNGINDIYICGGKSSVSTSIETVLSKYGDVERLAGQDRYETSKLVAEEFTDPEATTVFLAYGQMFPDGLCAGPLAARMDAALVLTENSKTSYAEEYVDDQSIGIGYVMGGTSVISDSAANRIMGTSSVIIK